MDFSGILIGAAAFLIIGIFHPIVIQCEYHFTEKIWPLFLAIGLIACIASIFIPHPVASAVLAVFGFSCLWSIKELKEQRERVKRGWFKENPKRAGK